MTEGLSVGRKKQWGVYVIHAPRDASHVVNQKAFPFKRYGSNRIRYDFASIRSVSSGRSQRPQGIIPDTCPESHSVRQYALMFIVANKEALYLFRAPLALIFFAIFYFLRVWSPRKVFRLYLKQNLF